MWCPCTTPPGGPVKHQQAFKAFSYWHYQYYELPSTTDCTTQGVKDIQCKEKRYVTTSAHAIAMQPLYNRRTEGAAATTEYSLASEQVSEIYNRQHRPAQMAQKRHQTSNMAFLASAQTTCLWHGNAGSSQQQNHQPQNSQPLNYVLAGRLQYYSEQLPPAVGLQSSH